MVKSLCGTLNKWRKCVPWQATQIELGRFLGMRYVVNIKSSCKLYKKITCHFHAWSNCISVNIFLSYHIIKWRKFVEYLFKQILFFPHVCLKWLGRAHPLLIRGNHFHVLRVCKMIKNFAYDLFEIRTKNSQIWKL